MEYKALSSWHAVLRGVEEGGGHWIDYILHTHAYTRSKYEDSKECRGGLGEGEGAYLASSFGFMDLLLYRSCQEANVYTKERTEKYEYDGRGYFFYGYGE